MKNLIEHLIKSDSYFAKKQYSDFYSHRYMKIKINSDDDLSLEKTINMRNVVILITFVFNENHTHY